MSSFTETFDAEKGAPGLGSFQIDFRPGTQDEVLGPDVERTAEVAGGAMENFKRDLIVVTGVDLGEEVTRSELIAGSIWQGVAVVFDLPVGADEARNGGWSISGPSPLFYLGNADSPGMGHVVSPGASMSSMAMWQVFDHLDSLTTGAIAGIPYSYSGLSTNVLGVEASDLSSARDVLNLAIQNTTVKTEYRFDPVSGMVFAAAGTSTAFRQTPQVMLTSEKAADRDGDLFAFSVSGRVGFDYASEARYAYSGASSGDFSERATYTYDGLDYPAGWGTAVVGVRVDESDIASTADLDDLLTSTYCRKERMVLNVDAYSLKDHLNAGDYVWVNCPEAFLVDTQENINFNGEETHPIKLRTSSLTCPIRKTHGVYVIHNATRYGGTNAVTRLNDFMEWPEMETEKASVSFGPIPSTRKLVNGKAWRKR